MSTFNLFLQNISQMELSDKLPSMQATSPVVTLQASKSTIAQGSIVCVRSCADRRSPARKNGTEPARIDGLPVLEISSAQNSTALSPGCFCTLTATGNAVYDETQHGYVGGTSNVAARTTRDRGVIDCRPNIRLESGGAVVDRRNSNGRFQMGYRRIRRPVGDDVAADHHQRWRDCHA
jgi:hypothetical protein